MAENEKTREEHQRDIAIGHIRESINNYAQKSRWSNTIYIILGATMVATGSMGGLSHLLFPGDSKLLPEIFSGITAVIAFIQTTARFNEDAFAYGNAHQILASALTSYNLQQIKEPELDRAQLEAKAVLGKRYVLLQGP